MPDPIPDLLQRLSPGQMRILLRQLQEELGAITPDSPLHAHHSARIAAIEAQLLNSPCDSSSGGSEQSSDHQPDPLAVDRLRRNAIVACLLVLFVFGTWIAFRLLPAPPPPSTPVELIEFDPNHPATPAVTPGFPWERLLLALAIAGGALAALAILAASFAIWRMRVRSSLPKTESRWNTSTWTYFKPTKEAVGTGIKWTVGAVVGLVILSGVYNLFNKGIDAAKELAKRPVVSQQKTTAPVPGSQTIQGRPSVVTEKKEEIIALSQGVEITRGVPYGWQWAVDTTDGKVLVSPENGKPYVDELGKPKPSFGQQTSWIKFEAQTPNAQFTWILWK